MADGLDFLMELEAKLDGATAMARELRKVEGLAEKLDKQLKATEKTGNIVFRKLGGWVKDFGKEVASSFTGMFAASAVWDSIKAGGALIVHMTEELVRAAGEAERTTRAFQNLLGVEVGDEVLDYLDQLSKHTEFTGGSLKAYAQDLLDAGFANTELKYALAATADVAARSRDKLGAAAGAVQTLEQVKLTGMIDSRGLRRLNIGPRQFFDQMAKDLGMSQKQVEERLRDGKIKTDDVLNSIYKALSLKGGRGSLGAVGADMATTFSARVQRLKDAVPNIFEEMAKTEGFTRLSDTVGGLADDLQPDGAIGGRIKEGLSQVFDQAAQAVAGFDWASGAQTLVDVLLEALSVTKAILGAVGSFFEGLEKVENVFRKVTSLGMAEDVATQRNREVNEELRNSPATIAARETDKKFRAWRDAQRVNQGFGFGNRELPTIESLAAQGLGKGAAMAEEAGAKMGTRFVAGTKGRRGIDAHSPSRKFAELGELSAEGFAQGFEMRAPSMAAGMFMDGLQVPAGGGPGPVTINAPVTVAVNEPGASAEQIAEEVARRSAASIREAIEELNLQAGNAYG